MGIPKIVVCSKSSLENCGPEIEERERKCSPRQRRFVRSRNRRNSRRLLANFLDRGSSSSSSRSASPCPSERDARPRGWRAVEVEGEVEGEGEGEGEERREEAEDDPEEDRCPGYRQYLRLLAVPQSPLEWAEASGDDLSSEWDSDYTDRSADRALRDRSDLKSSGWRKLRNIVHWTPFFQTYKKQRYPWVQLAGHQGNFRAGPTPGTILKKLCPQEEACFRLLMNDVLRPYVPEFKGVLDVREAEEGNAEEAENREETRKEADAEAGFKRTIVSSYLQLQDLLGEFEQPCVMDCKVGVRTYLESELAKAKERPKLRKDMYEKMVQVDPGAPSAEERRVQGVTKPRYMVWRETISSTATLGFRVEGIKLAHGGSSKDFKTTRSREQVTEALRRFVEGYAHAVPKYLQRLKAIRATLKASPFFASHEVVGSSLLFVHDAKNAGVWMIDFAKTLPLPQQLPRIRHDAEWQDIRNAEA
ncbi:hypothetical protein KM043_001698 [Ampulex compressa]|nr:hypothetical protein KM043_001698 [Ampulex compressa]